MICVRFEGRRQALLSARRLISSVAMLAEDAAQAHARSAAGGGNPVQREAFLESGA